MKKLVLLRYYFKLIIQLNFIVTPFVILYFRFTSSNHIKCPCQNCNGTKIKSSSNNHILDGAEDEDGDIEMYPLNGYHWSENNHKHKNVDGNEDLLHNHTTRTPHGAHSKKRSHTKALQTE